MRRPTASTKKSELRASDCPLISQRGNVKSCAKALYLRIFTPVLASFSSKYLMIRQAEAPHWLPSYGDKKAKLPQVSAPQMDPWDVDRLCTRACWWPTHNTIGCWWRRTPWPRGLPWIQFVSWKRERMSKWLTLCTIYIYIIYLYIYIYTYV